MFRTEINTVYGDIDSLKAEKQDNAIQIEELKRYLSKLEQEKIEENRAQVYKLSTLLRNLETRVGVADQVRNVLFLLVKRNKYEKVFFLSRKSGSFPNTLLMTRS